MAPSTKNYKKYETSMPVPGTQADDNRHAAFHLALNEKYSRR